LDCRDYRRCGCGEELNYESFDEIVYVQSSCAIEDVCHSQNKVCFGYYYIAEVQKDKAWPL